MGKILAKKRHSIRKSHRESLFKKLTAQIGESADLFLGERIEMVETDSPFTIYLIDKQPLLMEMDDWVFPTLRGAVARPFQNRQIVVDSGAVAFMAKGADVMRPGILSVSDDIKSGNPAVIIEERYRKPLAVVLALYDSEEIRNLERGKMGKNIHYIGDDIWNIEL